MTHVLLITAETKEISGHTVFQVHEDMSANMKLKNNVVGKQAGIIRLNFCTTAIHGYQLSITCSDH